jgi:hypothetical protein
MSDTGQVTAPAPPPPAGAPVPSPAPAPAPAPAKRRAPGRRFSVLSGSTPARLSTLSAITVLAAVAFGIIGAVAVWARASALDDARLDAQQLVRLQSIRTNLVQADAAASNAYLAGGLEVPSQRRQYEERLAAAARDLALAAQAGGTEEAESFGAVNDTLVRYGGLIESARANNRQQFPVGAAYLRQGSRLLRTEVLPVLSSTSEITEGRVLDAYDASDRAGILFGVAVVAALVVLAGGQLLLARTVHRYINVQLAVATVAVLAATLIGLATMTWAQRRAEDVRQGPYAATAALAGARVSAYDAKSQESLTLIFQGSGGDDRVWQGHVDEAGRLLAMAESAGGDRITALDPWRQVHGEIRRLDDAGDWRGAVARATGTGPDSSNAVFDAFASASQAELDEQATAAADRLGTTHGILLGTAVLVLVAGAVAAVASFLGYARRLEEYR